MSDQDRASRRRFLRQSFAFSALTGLGTLPTLAATAAAPTATRTPTGSHILMVGDWGSEDLAPQTQVAKAMQAYARDRKLRTEALFMLGDNWYGPLPDGVSDKRWQTQFEDMYPKTSFDCPAYAIPGNHDYQRMPSSKLDAELAYAQPASGKSSTRWTMPALWYTFTFPAIKPLATVIALDSNMPASDGTWDRGVDFTLTPERKAEQLAWFAAELAKPRTTPFLIVLGHHPIYSNGLHGDTATLVRDWEPLLRQHRVHLYLAGHDHDMQHLEFEGHPTSFALSGGGGADLYTLRIAPAKRGPYAEKIYGFSHLEVTPELLTLRHIDASGRQLHAFTKQPDGTVTLL